MNHNRRCKVRLVARGQLNDVPLTSAYSRVILIRATRLILFLSELNRLDLYSNNISTAYFKENTKEKYSP